LAGILTLLTACDPSPASRVLKGKTAAPLIGPADFPPSDPEPAMDSPGAPADDFIVTSPPEEPETSSPAPESKAETSDSSDSEGKEAFALLGESVAAGASLRLMWSASEIFEGLSTEAPVLVVNGRDEGPTMCLTAAIHGDELNGIEMVRRIIYDLNPEKLSGVVIGIPIVNLQGFRRGSRYLPDRRDLNRYFPGNAEGSSAARIAHSLFHEIVIHCDALVDLHTGSFYRTNLPQLRADLRYQEIRELSQGFGGMVVLHSEAAPGTLRRAAADAGIPAVTLEAGEPMRMQSDKVNQGVSGIFTLLNAMDMVKRVQLLAPPEPVFYESTWVRSNHGGILFSVVRLGQVVEPGDVLGTVTDPITNEQNLIYSPEKGRVLGMALNQVVMPGFASFRIGLETDDLATDPMVASINWNIKSRSRKAPAEGAAQAPENEEANIDDTAEEASE